MFLEGKGRFIVLHWICFTKRHIASTLAADSNCSEPIKIHGYGCSRHSTAARSAIGHWIAQFMTPLLRLDILAARRPAVWTDSASPSASASVHLQGYAKHSCIWMDDEGEFCFEAFIPCILKEWCLLALSPSFMSDLSRVQPPFFLFCTLARNPVIRAAVT